MKSSDKKSVLFMDDELELIHHYIKQVEMDGFQVETATSEIEAKAKLKRNNIDMAILDANLLPSLRVIEIKQAQKSVGDAPFVEEEGAGYRVAVWIKDNFPLTGAIVLTSERTEALDKINGLDCGADDYVIKGIPPAELTSRIKAVLRRLRPQVTKLTFGPFSLNQASRVLEVDQEKSVSLTISEVRLLALLALQPNKPKSRADLYSGIFERPIPSKSDRAVDNLLSKLRRKALRELKLELPINTLYGGGYVLDD